jgi:hypothetical protein
MSAVLKLVEFSTCIAFFIQAFASDFLQISRHNGLLPPSYHACRAHKKPSSITLDGLKLVTFNRTDNSIRFIISCFNC